MSSIITLKEAIDKRELWAECRQLRRGEFLKQAGQAENDVYYIVSGALQVYVLSENGEEQVIRFGYAGSFITALDAYINGGTTVFYMQAIKKTELLRLSKAVFKSLINSDMQLMKIWQAGLEQLVYQQIERELDLLTASPLARYERVLGRSPQLFQEIPSRYIASYLRMRAETFSRLKRELANKNK